MTAHSPRLRAAALAAAVLAALAHPAAAQPIRSVQLTSDNDAYDFWIPMSVRPDYEYSNGARLSMELDGARGWAGLAARLGPCAAEGGEADAEAGCASTTIAASHRLYSPREDSWVPVRGHRPFAGWLGVAATGRVVDGPTRRTLSLELGVTGGPSLGQTVQEAYHRIAGFWNPVGWRHQLGFEPAFSVGYGVERRVAELRSGGTRAADAVVRGGAEAGTLRTGVSAGVRVRAGRDLAHAFAGRPARGTSLYVVAGLEGELVARDLFLDGNTFSRTPPRVTREPWIARSVWGVGVARRGLGAEFRVSSRTRAYREEPGGHPFGTIEITWRR